jgi:hypothetical protein
VRYPATLAEAKIFVQRFAPKKAKQLHMDTIVR